jgi:hypothetical protein
MLVATVRQIRDYALNKFRSAHLSPLEIGVLVMVISFPVGFLFSTSEDPRAQYLANHLSSLFSIGLGFVLAYAYIDKFNERAEAVKFKEVDAVSLVNLDNEIARLVMLTIFTLFKKQNKAINDGVNNDVMEFMQLHNFYFDDDRQQRIRVFFQTIVDKLEKVDPFTSIDDVENRNFVKGGKKGVERLSVVYIPRILMGRLNTEVKEALLIAEEEIGNDFGSLEYAADSWDLFEGQAELKKQQVFTVYGHLRMLLDKCFHLILYLDNLQEGTAYREYQKEQFRSGVFGPLSEKVH